MQRENRETNEKEIMGKYIENEEMPTKRNRNM